MVELRALRPLLLLLTVIAVLLAVVTTTGRVFVALLPQIETQLNTLVIASGVELAGVDGAWHRLNPVIRVANVRFVGGRAADVAMEVDLLGSAIHGALVMRHLSARVVELMLVKDADGRWHPGGAGGGSGAAISLDALLRYSEGLEFPEVRVLFMPSAEAAAMGSKPLGELHVNATIANSFLHHSGEFLVRVAAGGGGEIKLGYDVTQGLFRYPSRGRIALRSQQLTIAPEFGVAVGGGGAKIDTLSGDWSFAESGSDGALALSARDVVLPTGVLEGINVAARGSMESFGLRWTFVFDRVEVRGTHSAVDLDGMAVALASSLDGSRSLEFSLPTVDVESLGSIVGDAAGNVDRGREWLTGLDPRGRLNAIVGRIDLSNKKLSYSAAISDLALENFKGVPYVRNGSATVAGTERAVQINLDSKQVELGFLNFYATPFQFDTLTGELLVWFRPGYLALSGRELSVVAGATTANGQFALARPEDPLEQRLFAALRLNNVDGRGSLAYVPNALPVRAWLDQAILGGYVDQADLLYHGHLRVIENLPMRQAELSIRLHDGDVRFHSAWPRADGVTGQVLVTTAGVRGDFDRGNLVGIDLANASVQIPRSFDHVEVAGVGTGDGKSLRTLIDSSPLTTWLAFVKPEWEFAGTFDFTARMTIPIKPDAAPATVDLTLNLNGLNVSLADMNLELGSLRGPLHYRLPLDVEADRIDGVLFGQPAKFAVHRRDKDLQISFAARAEARSLSKWRKVPNPGVATGEFDFDGEYRIQPGTAQAPVLAVRSDLVGVKLDLPAPLRKTAQEAWPSTLAITFAPDYDHLDVQLGAVMQGWLRLQGGGVHAGAIGLGVIPAPERGDEDAVTLSGGVAQLDLSEWFSPERRAKGGPGFAWAVDELKIGRGSYRNIGFDDIVADAWGRDGQVEVSITSAELEGSVKMAAENPAQIDLHYLKIPGRDGEKTGDPLANVDAGAIGELDVVIQNVQLGDVDYGKWQFQTRRFDSGLAINNLIADTKGLHIDSPSGTSWTSGSGSRTAFKGQISAGDLAVVLPQWGYAPTLETTATMLDADLSWAGSPFNFSLPIVVGRLAVTATKGRFIDAGDGTGAVRIFSLLNFAAIVKRMTLDFSDVFGKGITFEKVSATAMANQGTINLVEPMVIEGTGGNFQINGSVNFLTGALDNEMLVTLPVTSSLPWYAAYLGFVNPLAAGAVLVGERIFRNQIEKFSSAKYKVTGTVQDPKVTFVQVFPKALAEPVAVTAEAATPVATPPTGAGPLPGAAAPDVSGDGGTATQSPKASSHSKHKVTNKDKDA